MGNQGGLLDSMTHAERTMIINVLRENPHIGKQPPNRPSIQAYGDPNNEEHMGYKGKLIDLMTHADRAMIIDVIRENPYVGSQPKVEPEIGTLALPMGEDTRWFWEKIGDDMYYTTRTRNCTEYEKSQKKYGRYGYKCPDGWHVHGAKWVQRNAPNVANAVLGKMADQWGSVRELGETQVAKRDANPQKGGSNDEVSLESRNKKLYIVYPVEVQTSPQLFINAEIEVSKGEKSNKWVSLIGSGDVVYGYENNANKITLTTIGSSVLANEAITIKTNYKKQRRAVSGSQHIPVESPIKKELTEKEQLAIADQVSQLIGRIDEDMLREFVKDLAEKTVANELTLEYVIKRGNELLGEQ